MTPLYIDTSRGALVVNPQTTQRCLPPVLTIGDTVPLTLSFLQRNPQPLNTGQPIYLYQDFSAAGVTFALGTSGPVPTGGSFTLTWTGSTTPALPFNCSSYDVAAALNALDSISHNGGVTVTGQVSGPFVVSWLLPALRGAITVNATGLYPLSAAAVMVNTVGTTTTTARQTISFAQAVTTVVNSWTPQAAAAITVTQLQANVIQAVAIPVGTYGGTFTLTINALTTAAIPFNAQFDLVQSAINTLLGITTATVVAGQNSWTITIPANTFAFTGTATGLRIPLSLTGSLVLTSPALLASLSGLGWAPVPFAIQTTAAGVQTILAGNFQVNTGPAAATAPALPSNAAIYPRPDINGITGTSAPLDAIATASGAIPVGTIFVLTLPISGFEQGQQWQLVASPPASNGVTSQRGQDYNASTNNVGWIRIS